MDAAKKSTKTTTKGAEAKKTTQASKTATKPSGSTTKTATKPSGSTTKTATKKTPEQQKGNTKGTTKVADPKKPSQATKKVTKTAEVNTKAEVKKVNKVGDTKNGGKAKATKPAGVPKKKNVANTDSTDVLSSVYDISGNLASAKDSFAMLTERVRVMDTTLLSSVFMVVAVLALAFGGVRVVMNKYRWYRIGQSKKYDGLPNKWEDVYGRHPMAETA